MIVKGREKAAKDKLTEEQSHLLSNIGLVLYILFREISENQSLDDIVQSQVFDAIDEYSLRISSKKYHKEILLVCDGLDETSLENGQILEIINGKQYPNIRCIVTCRPHASLGMSLTADAEIRLKGFSKDQARHYVDVYFIQMHPVNTKKAEQESKKLWCEIESSPDLQEMAINPSMLQLLCKLFLVNGKIAKDRASVFKDYTHYLLQQYHIKKQKKYLSERSLNTFYKDTLLKVGNLALQGLKQSHFQLVFTRDVVESIAGKEMFEIGFITELPSYRNEKSKVQFQHKTHQEYLAAYFIVNSPEDVGMKYLMEFCSTSKSLMGSQIVLTFIIAMSKEMGKVVQKQVKELVSSWASEDDVSPKDRTSFLLTMLKENRSLVFPLPNEVDLNLREYEANISWMQWFLNLFGRKDTLEQFLDFDNRGVLKLTIALGEKCRLQLLNKFRNSSLIECVINFQKKVSVDDKIYLKDLIESNKKLESICMSRLSSQGVQEILRNSTVKSSLECSKHLKMLKIHEIEFESIPSVSNAFRHLPNHLALDLSGNKFTDQFGCKALIQKAARQKALIMQDCGIIIDTEIAEAISQLPEQANLDLSGNTVTKMDSRLLSHVIPVVRNKKIDLSGLGVLIDSKVAEAICSLPDEADVDISDTITQMDVNLFSKLLYRLNKDSKVTVWNNASSMETSLVEAIYCKPDNTNLDISCNDIYKQDVILSLLLTADYWKPAAEQHNIKKLPQSPFQCRSQSLLELHFSKTDKMQRHIVSLIASQQNVTFSPQESMMMIHASIKLNPVMVTLISSHEGITCPTDTLTIYKEFTEPLIAKALKQGNLDVKVNKNSETIVSITFNTAIHKPSLNISNCNVTINQQISDAMENLHGDVDISGNQISDQYVCTSLINLSKQFHSLNMSNCGLEINTEIAKALSKLPDHTQLDLSGNQVTDKSACISLIHKATTMKSLNIHDCISNCGIEIDTEITEAVTSLPDHTQLDLSGNQVTDKSACITLIHKAATMKSLSICNCGIKIDTEIAEVVSRLPDHTQLDLSGNQVTDKSACITLIHKAATMKSLSMCNCGIQIDTEIAESVSRLPDPSQLDLSGNQDTDKSACITLIHKAATMKPLSICNYGIEIDTEIAEAVSRLPDHTQLDLSGNQVTDKSACITLIHKAATMKSLSMCNCGIQIDTEIAKDLSRLPDHTQLDLSGNVITKMEPYLLSRILSHMTKQEKIDINGWGITVDEDIVRALSKLSTLQTLIINFYINTANNILTSRASLELPQTVSFMPHLQVLRLDDCNISNDVIVALTDSLYKYCHLLEELSLRHNHLSSGVWEVVEHIQQMKNLRWLWFDGNPCMKDDKQRDKIETTLHRSNLDLYVRLY